MKTLKQITFESALYHKDEYNRLKQELGEFDRITCIEYAKYTALLHVIAEAGYIEDWDEYIKKVFYAREHFKQMQEVK